MSIRTKAIATQHKNLTIYYNMTITINTDNHRLHDSSQDL